MATSGSFNSSSIGNFYATISWWRTGYSATNNEHYISWSIIAHNTPGSYRTVYARSLTINGSSQLNVTSNAYGANGKQCYDGTEIASGSMTIPSSDSAGNGSVTISFTMGVGIYPGTNVSSGDGPWTLDRIPRYTSFTNHYISATTLNSFTVYWSAADTCSNVYYSFNGGGWTWVDGNKSSGTYRISGQSPGTTFNVRTKIVRSDSGLETISGYLYPTTCSIATVSNVQTLILPAPNNATNVQHYISNYSTQTAQVYMEKVSETGVYAGCNFEGWGNGSDGWVNYPVPVAAVNQMYIDNPSATYFNMKLAIQTSEDYSYWDADIFTVEFSESNAGPTGIATCTYLDTNEQVRKLTGSSANAVSSDLKIIPGYSHVQINVPESPIVIRPYSGATQGTVSIGGRAAKTATTSSTEIFYNATASSYDIVGRDSRGYPATRTMKVNLYPYSGVTISSFSATRDGTDNKKGSYTITGTYQNSNYGGSIANYIKTIEVTCDNITIGAATITHNADKGTWSATGTLSDLVVGTSYTLTASVADYAGETLGLANKTSTTTVNSGQFLMTAAKGQGVCFGGLYNLAKGGAAQLGGDGMPILGFNIKGRWS